MKRLDFNQDWKFYIEGEEPVTPVQLPHDAMLLSKRTPDSPGGQALGYFTGGVYKYEKVFSVSSEWAGKRLILEFEGVYRNAEVSLNGQKLSCHAYGYTRFFVDLSSAVKPGQENILLVRADNSDLPNSRWYTGGGIYRPVWLHLGGENAILPEGIKVTTLSYDPARIRVETEHTGGEVQIEIRRKGKVTASADGDRVELEIPDADLWSEESPDLYQCHAVLMDQGTVVDEAQVFFGIRKLEWSAKGFFVNGKETLLRGGCVHHDNGLLGAATYSKAEERRVRILKENGFNAIRSAHNPISEAMLDACDKYGIYVMDEAWDMWYKPKMKHDYAKDFEACWMDDLSAMIQRDYNHPCVIMYSVGNEVSEPHDEKGLALAKKLVDAVHSLDPTRPVTCGLNLMILRTAAEGKAVSKADTDEGKEEAAKMPAPTNSTMFNMMAAMIGTGMNKSAANPEVDAATSPVLDLLDIGGYNYASGRYPLDGDLHPDRIIVGSETFPQDIAKNWEMVKKYPYLIGDFMWTAWDYLGEAGLGAWTYHKDGCTFDKPYPWLLADAGAIDILGHPGAEAAYAAVVWGVKKEPYIGVMPLNHPKEALYKATWRGTNAMDSWAWKGCEGNKTTVVVYAEGAGAELLQNGKRVGRSKLKDHKAEFKVKYIPGTLTAVVYDQAGNETGRSELHSGNGELGIRLTAEQGAAVPGELIYVDVDLAYSDGVVESNADLCLEASVTGGELLGFGSADPHTEESYLSGKFTTYYGRAQAVVRCGDCGTVTLKVSGGGYTEMKEILVECEAGR